MFILGTFIVAPDDNQAENTAETVVLVERTLTLLDFPPLSGV